MVTLLPIYPLSLKQPWRTWIKEFTRARLQKRPKHYNATRSVSREFSIRSDSMDDPVSIGARSQWSSLLRGLVSDQKFYHNNWHFFSKIVIFTKHIPLKHGMSKPCACTGAGRDALVSTHINVVARPPSIVTLWMNVISLKFFHTTPIA